MRKALFLAGLFVLFTLPYRAVRAQGVGPEAKVLVILGDSLTAGLGIPAEKAYPSLLEAKARKSGIGLRVVNGGMSGDTSAGGLRRLGWLLRDRVDVFMVALGANDGLRGLDTAALRSNLRSIFDAVKEKYPAASLVVAGMKTPPNMGDEYGRSFEEAFRDVAAEASAAFIPFLLDGVAADPSLNLPDRMHPNERGHEVIAERVWKVVGPLLGANHP